MASAGCLVALMATGMAAASARGTGAASASVISASRNDVSCTSAHTCMAVGTFLTSKGPEFTLAET